MAMPHTNPVVEHSTGCPVVAMLRRTALLVALLTACVQVNAISFPIDDVPYTEHVSTRWVNSSGPVVEGWPRLPTASPYQVEVGTFGGTDGVYYLAPEGLFWLDFAGDVTPLKVVNSDGSANMDCVAASKASPFGKMEVDASCSLVMDATSGTVQALVASTGLHWLSCGSATNVYVSFARAPVCVCVCFLPPRCSPSPAAAAVPRIAGA